MRAGTLDRRITLQHVTQTRDDHGQAVNTWTAYATVWAQRLDVTARERFTAQQPLAEKVAKFKIRYRDDVLPTDRIVCESVTYNIAPPVELGRREALEIVGTAVA